MARTLYINPDAVNGPVRATQLGCGWMPTVPSEFVSLVSALPVVILTGQGITEIISDIPPTTSVVVAAALAPILALEQNAAAAQSALSANLVTVQQRATAALVANANYLALGNPTNLQVVAQVQLLTKECNALIRLVLGLGSTITDTG
jgi:hypothetical protein